MNGTIPSNLAIIDQLICVCALSKEKNPKRFEERVELAIAQENDELMEEKAALAAQLEREHSEREEKDKLDEQEREERRITQEREKARVEEAERARQAAEAARLSEADQHTATKKDLAQTAAEREKERKEKEAAEKRARAAEDRATQASLEKQRVVDLLKATGVTLLVMAGLWGLLYGTTWGLLEWLRVHPNSYGIQLAIAVGTFSLALAAFRKEWRSLVIIAGVLGALLIIAQLLGGPGAAPPSK